MVYRKIKDGFSYQKNGLNIKPDTNYNVQNQVT